jgi:predicted nucleic acid-binding protein
MIVVDTNVISETMRVSPSPVVIDWLASHAHDCAITAITVGELLAGVAILPDGARKRGLTGAIEQTLLGFAHPLTYDAKAARVYATFRAMARHAGRGLSTEDGMIAAICVANDAALATRNVADFSFLPIEVVNPWQDVG